MHSPSYQSLEALLHDEFWACEGPPAELDFLARHLRRHPGPALEVGCGSGRLLLPLLQQSFQVDGLDSSSDMLDLCRENARRLDLSPTLFLADLQTFTPPALYRSLLLPAFTLQLIPDPESTLRHLRSWLQPGGHLYFSVFLPLAELSGELTPDTWYPDHQTRLADGSTATLRTRFRLQTREKILHREHHYTLESAGRIREQFTRQSILWRTPRQWRNLLLASGFTPVDGFAEFDPEIPIDDDAQILTITARRDASELPAE